MILSVWLSILQVNATSYTRIKNNVRRNVKMESVAYNRKKNQQNTQMIEREKFVCIVKTIQTDWSLNFMNAGPRWIRSGSAIKIKQPQAIHIHRYTTRSLDRRRISFYAIYFFLFCFIHNKHLSHGQRYRTFRFVIIFSFYRWFRFHS